MPSTEEIKQRIEAAIPDSSAEVEDWTGGGDHFRATVVSPAFAGLSRIEQHRLVINEQYRSQPMGRRYAVGRCRQEALERKATPRA